MKQAHIFNAGPAALPREVLDATSDAVRHFVNGMSLLEISHRSKEWMEKMDETRTLMKEVLRIPEGYSVLFLQGGASLQFYQIPLNFLKTRAAYLDTGVWSSKAIEEAKKVGDVVVVGSGKSKNYASIPPFAIPTTCDYLHITTNNTIYGTEMLCDIDSPIPLVADMSSDFLSRPIDVAKYALIYAGAQKNAGAAGVTVVIVRDAFMDQMKEAAHVPNILTYKLIAQHGSMYNTPPVSAIFVVNQVLQWIKRTGGLQRRQAESKEKAALLYDEIERNTLFHTTVEKDSRSLMNICFVWNDGFSSLEPQFLAFLKERNIIGLKGHRLVGGFRASCYNGVSVDDVKCLVTALQDFEKSVS